MSDLVERLRESVRACRALDRSALLTEAADEIVRLKGEVVLHQAVASLSGSEREAVEQAADVMQSRGMARHAAWLRGLVDRLAYRRG